MHKIIQKNASDHVNLISFRWSWNRSSVYFQPSLQWCRSNQAIRSSQVICNRINIDLLLLATYQHIDCMFQRSSRICLEIRLRSSHIHAINSSIVRDSWICLRSSSFLQGGDLLHIWKWIRQFLCRFFQTFVLSVIV